MSICLAEVCWTSASAWADEGQESEATPTEALPEIPDYSTWALDELKQEVDSLTASRDELAVQNEQLMSRILEERTRLAAITKRLEALQQTAERAVKERYKIQRQGTTLIDALLCAEDFDSLLAGIEYIEKASEASVDGVVDLRQQKASSEQETVQLESEQAQATARLEHTSAMLEEATRARDEAQYKADLVANAILSPDGADWGAGEDAFVAVWAPRIDAYLAGSPLAGQGKTFAKAAWDNHIDPRFSPAISTVESSKGSVCIRPYNAWGWGAADSNPYGLASEWSSWEEAINAHASGLAKGYGYTVSIEGAKKYCPLTWESWYATTVSEMNRI